MWIVHVPGHESHNLASPRIFLHICIKFQCQSLWEGFVSFDFSAILVPIKQLQLEYERYKIWNSRNLQLDYSNDHLPKRKSALGWQTACAHYIKVHRMHDLHHLGRRRLRVINKKGGGEKPIWDDTYMTTATKCSVFPLPLVRIRQLNYPIKFTQPPLLCLLFGDPLPSADVI